MAGTATVSIDSTAYVSLGTGPMYVSPQGPIMVVALAGGIAPVPSTPGHVLNPFMMPGPFNFTLAEQLWAIAIVPGGVMPGMAGTPTAVLVLVTT